MNNIEKLLINLESTKANIRYEACEELRVAKAISKQANDALEKATNDPDPLVADAAQRALLIHKHLGVEGMMEDQKNNDKTEIKYQKLNVLAIISFVLSIIAFVGFLLDDGRVVSILLASSLFALIVLFKQRDEKKRGKEINGVTNSFAMISLVFIFIASFMCVLAGLAGFAY